MMTQVPFKIVEHTIPAQHIREWPRATAVSQEDVLRIHVKQYTPLDNLEPQPGDVTIIGAHGNGFPKELYEALWVDLHAQSKRHGFRIRGIWMTDVANQGVSGRLNEQLLGDDPGGFDYVRDLLYMVNVFRDDMPRPIVGIGHSFGACVLLQLSLIHARLLTSLVLLDPAIGTFTSKQTGLIASIRLSALRRDTWPSRKAAESSFRRSPFHSVWDARVLDAWMEFGIRELPGGKAVLTTTRHQEIFTAARPLYPYIQANGTVDRDGAPDFNPTTDNPPDLRSEFPFYRSELSAIMNRLPHVRPSVLWMFGATSNVNLPPSTRIDAVQACGTGPGGSGGCRAGKVSTVSLENCGHLLPFEDPTLCAKHAATWIGNEMQRYRNDEREYEQWTRLSMHEKATLSQKFVDRLGHPFEGAEAVVENKKPKL